LAGWGKNRNNTPNTTRQTGKTREIMRV